MDGLADTFRGRNVILSIGDSALKLAPCHDACTVYTMDLNRQTVEIMMALGAGAISTGVNRVTGAMMTAPVSSVPSAPTDASAGPAPANGGDGDDGDDGGSGGSSTTATVILIVISVIALALAVFVFVILYRERKGRPMFVSMDVDEKENELVANRSVGNVESTSTIETSV